MVRQARRTKKSCGDSCGCNDCSKHIHNPATQLPLVEPPMVE